MLLPENPRGGGETDWDAELQALVGQVDLEPGFSELLPDSEPVLRTYQFVYRASATIGDLFRDEVLAAVSDVSRESFANEILDRFIAQPNSRITPGDKMGFRGLGILLVAPNKEKPRFGTYPLASSQHIVGALRRLVFDQYWRMVRVQSSIIEPSASSPERRVRTNCHSEWAVGPVAELEDASIHFEEGTLDKYWPIIRVPMADYSFRPLKLFEP